jgi:hypothetical protein
MKRTIALILAVSSLALAGCCTTHQTGKWEYMQQSGQLSDADLNKLADQGWSVVSTSIGPGGTVFYVLKRHK